MILGPQLVYQRGLLSQFEEQLLLIEEEIRWTLITTTMRSKSALMETRVGALTLLILFRVQIWIERHHYSRISVNVTQQILFRNQGIISNVLVIKNSTLSDIKLILTVQLNNVTIIVLV